MENRRLLGPEADRISASPENARDGTRENLRIVACVYAISACSRYCAVVMHIECAIADVKSSRKLQEAAPISTHSVHVSHRGMD